MKEKQIQITAMMTAALINWTLGVETPLFTQTEETRDICACMIWYFALNAMAYGYERGVASGGQTAESENEDDV